ncbi:MAG TPA: hypothetical protein VGP52_01990 [Stellaceae bacterium]|jgi:hypothetical protein|nr:hypothetical protein [Stellaceae bacterium]
MIDRLVLVLLLGGCALFAAITIAEFGSRRDLAASALATPTRSDAAPLPPHPPPRGQYDELLATILARPLFSSTRRPPPPGGRDAAADSGLADTRLTGIVIAPGHRIAIFAPIGTKAVIVSEGEVVSGWRVERITARQVSLTGPDGTRTLQPKFDPNLAPPASAAGPGNAPPALLPAALAPAASRPRFPPMPPNRPPPRPGERER